MFKSRLFLIFNMEWLPLPIDDARYLARAVYEQFPRFAPGVHINMDEERLINALHQADVAPKNKPFLRRRWPVPCNCFTDGKSKEFSLDLLVFNTPTKVRTPIPHKLVKSIRDMMFELRTGKKRKPIDPIVFYRRAVKDRAISKYMNQAARCGVLYSVTGRLLEKRRPYPDQSGYINVVLPILFVPTVSDDEEKDIRGFCQALQAPPEDYLKI